ncbi:MAG: hypothetical protein O2954_07710 [bacterium]|nr:hypothetical protein [bacterium]
MTSRERVKMALSRKQTDRIPVHDTIWRATLSRWHREGLSEEIPAAEYFGFEMCGFGADLSPRFPLRVLEKNETFIVETTPTGGVRRNFRDYSTTPEVVDWPIRSRSDWQPIRKRLEPDFSRVDWVSLRTGFERAREEGKFITFHAPMGYDQFQTYMKTDELLVAMVTDTEWLAEAFRTHAELLVAMAKMMIEAGFHFDGAFLFNDMGYRNGLLFSPDLYRRTLLETDRMICDFFHQYNMPVILHSCGRVRELIPHLIEAGFDCLQPLEVKAGMDVRELKSEFGDRLAFMGGIDVRAMSDPDPDVLEEEICSKFEVVRKVGGYIYHSDHSIPKDVSFDQYRRVMALVEKYGRN